MNNSIETVEDILSMSMDDIKNKSFIKNAKELTFVSKIIREKRVKPSFIKIYENLLEEKIKVLIRDKNQSIEDKDNLIDLASVHFTKFSKNTQISIYNTFSPEEFPIKFTIINKYNPEAFLNLKSQSEALRYSQLFNNYDYFCNLWLDNQKEITLKNLGNFILSIFCIDSRIITGEDIYKKINLSDETIDRFFAKTKVKNNEKISIGFETPFKEFNVIFQSQETEFEKILGKISDFYKNNNQQYDLEMSLMKVLGISTNDIQAEGLDRVTKKIVYSTCVKQNVNKNDERVFYNLNTIIKYSPNIKSFIEDKTNLSGVNAINKIFVDAIDYLKYNELFKSDNLNSMNFSILKQGNSDSFLMPPVLLLRESVFDQIMSGYQNISKIMNYKILSKDLINKDVDSKTKGHKI